MSSRKQKKPEKPVPKDVQTINVGTSSKIGGALSLPREPSTGKACILRVLFCEEATDVINKIVSMEDVEPTEVSSKEDVQISNVGTFLKSGGASSLPREPSTGKACILRVLFCEEATADVINKIVSMEDVEPTEVAPSSEDREASSTTPSVEEIINWSPGQVISFLKSKSDKLYLREKDINIIKDNWVAGQAFLLLTVEDLVNKPYNLAGGPAKSIAYLIQTLKGGEQKTQKIKITEAFPKGLIYKKPKPLVASYGSNWQYQYDEELVEILRDHTEMHYINFKKKNCDKMNCPAYFLFSGAGTGKSRNASEFHNMLIKSLEDSNNLELMRMIEDAWVFNVSLENGTSFSREIEPSDFLAIGSRMLWQVYTGDHDFRRFLYTYDPPTPDEVIQLIAKGHNIGKEDMKKIAIILVVDGLQNFMKSNNDGLDKNSAFYQTLSIISDLGVNNDRFLIPYCTATITCPFDQVVQPSMRLRVHLPIASLKPPTILGDDNHVTRVFQDNHIMNLLVNDCGGHGRALEALAEIIGDRDINDCNFNQLMNNLRARLVLRYPGALNISVLEAQAIARAILTRTFLDYRNVVPGTTRTPYYFAQPGLIRFVKGSCAEGYFNAPYIWVWIMSQPLTPGGDPLLRDWQFCDYGERAATFDRRRIPGAQFWNHFEYFIPTFRCLKSKVLKEGEKTNISKIHAGARLKLNDSFDFTNHHLTLEHAKHQEVTDSSNAKTNKILCEDSMVNVREGKHCIINGWNAPYGDSFLGLDQSGKSNPNEVHQSKKWKTAKITEKLYYDERKKSAGDKDFFILFTTGKSDNFELPANSGIVDSSNWDDYFGPFAGRAYNYAIVGALDINVATSTELMTVYDMGDTTVSKLIEKRPFDSMDAALREVNIRKNALKRLKVEV